MPLSTRPDIHPHRQPAARHGPDFRSHCHRTRRRRLCAEFGERFARSAALTAQAREGLSDLQFTSAYRVPFQFSPYLRAHLKLGGFVQASAAVTVTDLDGNEFDDQTGSYGRNVFGYDFYKECIAEAVVLAGRPGPVLGAYHPCVAGNVARLREISGHGARAGYRCC